MRASIPAQAPMPVGARLHVTVPLVGATVRAGFPFPADDYLDKLLDFNELLIENPDATFAVRVAGDCMIDAGIFPGDIAIVDRSKTAHDRSIILTILDGEFTIKQFRQRGQPGSAGTCCCGEPSLDAFREDLGRKQFNVLQVFLEELAKCESTTAQ